MYAQYLRFLPVAGLRFTFHALYPSPTGSTFCKLRILTNACNYSIQDASVYHGSPVTD